MPMLTIRDDLTTEEMRRLARRERDARVGRRMLAIANALDGMSRAMAAKLAGMDRQTLRDWVIRYNERGVAGLGDRWGPGRPTAVDDGQLGGGEGRDPAGGQPGRRCQTRVADRRCRSHDRGADGREL